MKTAILMMMLGVAPVAYAQSSPPQISDQDVKRYWLLFQKLQHAVEDPGGTLAVLRPSGMSEAGAAEFSRFALQALDDHLRAVDERMVGMCQHQEALKASRNAFADALDQNKTASEAMKRALVAILGVGLTTNIAFDTWTGRGSWTSRSQRRRRNPLLPIHASPSVGLKLRKVRLDLTSGTMPGPTYTRSSARS